MSDETNELLRQLLDTQRQMLAAYQKEMERTSEFRISVVETQKAAQRKGLIVVAIIVGAGMVMLLLGVLAVKN